MADPAAALRVAVQALRQGKKPTLHQFGGRTLSMTDLSAIAGMSALVGYQPFHRNGNVTAQMLGLSFSGV